jgi:hypothetical protein
MGLKKSAEKAEKAIAGPLSGPRKENSMAAPNYGWLFADDGRDFRAKMIAFIRENFADLLGDRIRLLDEPGGLEMLGALTRDMLKGTATARA